VVGAEGLGGGVKIAEGEFLGRGGGVVGVDVESGKEVGERVVGGGGVVVWVEDFGGVEEDFDFEVVGHEAGSWELRRHCLWVRMVLWLRFFLVLFFFGGLDLN